MKSVSVCVLTLAAILIGTVYGTLYGKVNPMAFLHKYGYLEGNTGGKYFGGAKMTDVRKAIVQFQRFNGLPQTGIMDETTEKKMNAPRCGIKDFNGKSAKYLTKSKWPKHLLTWKINKYSQTSRLSVSQQRRAISQGINRWADVTPLVFQETGDKPTFDVSFEKGRHGDGYPFDGLGPILGHAFFPQDGATHFDDDQNWIDGNIGGIDLETVAAHEFGHALGLAHSSEKKSLMAPSYQFLVNYKLHSDDVAGIQSLYGKKDIVPTTRAPRMTTRRIRRGKGFCNYLYRHIDAAMRISRNDVVFVDKGGVIDGRTGHNSAVKSLFPGGPKWVQAAVYSKQTGKAYLFKDKMVWAYTLRGDRYFSLVKTFPKNISNSRSHNPETAILLNNKIYLLKRRYIFEFVNEDVAPGEGHVSRVLFNNIPNRVDATVTSGHTIHFIVKKRSYEMTNKPSSKNRGKPAKRAFNKCRN